MAMCFQSILALPGSDGLQALSMRAGTVGYYQDTMVIRHLRSLQCAYEIHFPSNVLDCVQ